MFQNDELAWEISDFLNLEKDEIKRFRKKVIPKSVVTKMEKQKEEMRIEKRDERARELEGQLFNAIPDSEIPEEIEIKKESDEEVIEKSEKKKDVQTSLFNF